MPDRRRADHAVRPPSVPAAPVTRESAAEQLATAARTAAARLTASQLQAAQEARTRLESARGTAAARIAAEHIAAVEAGAARLVIAEQQAHDRLTRAELASATRIAAATIRADVDSRAAPGDPASTTTAAERLQTEMRAASDELAVEQMAAAEEVAQARLAAALSAAEQLGASRLIAAEQLAAERVAAEQLIHEQEAAAQLAAAEQVAAEQLSVAAALAASQLAEAEEVFRLAMDHSAVGTCLVSADGQFTRVNPAFGEMLGRQPEELIGSTWAGITHPDDLPKILGLNAELLAAERSSFRTLDRYLADDGRVIWGDTSVAAIRNDDGTVRHVVAQVLDVTDRITSERELAALVTHDPLTGLANRAAMLDEITRAVAAGRRSGTLPAVLLIDLDHFKNVNDSLGHAAGDELLIAAARRVDAMVRTGDLTARLGGDEFVVVMRDVDGAPEALRTGWRLVRAFRDPFATSSGELFATASIGVALASETGSDGADDLLREADTAMYVAKSQGRDRLYLFNEELRAAVTSRLLIEGDLRHALDRGELDVWYQPEIDLATGRVISVEALLRWHHPSGELYPAGRFIEVAEECGLILEIGAWVLKQVCAQAAAWTSAGAHAGLVVSVNVSTLQLAEDGLLDVLDDALVSSGVDPALLCIEITETALVRETDVVRRNLLGIHERGMKIAIDDFGTGFASLTYLHRYPVDVLKIDRSFVTNIVSNDFDRRLVSGILALVHHLGIAVTAEGVEQQDQADCLLELGCPGAQGFLYSQAVPPAEIGPLLDMTFSPV